MIYVCSLARLKETVASTGARRVITLINAGTPMQLPETVRHDDHLFLAMNDIIEPVPGMTPPAREQIETMLKWVADWDRAEPLVVHCYAGISRSTAAAFSIAAALAPQRDEMELALTLRHRSPSATPNRRIIGFADEILGRRGRMLSAVDHIGRGADAFEGTPFRLDLAADPA